MRFALAAVAAAPLLAGCGSPTLSDHAAGVICLEMTTGGTYWTAVETAKREGITDPDEQKAAIFAAVRDHCSQYLHAVTW